MKIEIHFKLVRFVKGVAAKAHRVAPTEIAVLPGHPMNTGVFPTDAATLPCRNRLTTRKGAIARLISMTLAILSSAAAPAYAQGVFRANLAQQQTGGVSFFGGVAYLKIGAHSGEFQIELVNPFDGNFTPVIQTPSGSITFSLGPGEPWTYSGCDPFRYNPFLPIPAPLPGEVTCPAFMTGNHYTGSFDSSRPIFRDLLAGRGVLRLLSDSGVLLKGSIIVQQTAPTSGNNLPPVVVMNPSLLGPIHGIWVFLGTQASDADGEVVSVEYIVNGTSIGTVKGQPRRLYDPDGSPSPVNPLILSDFNFFWSLPTGEYDLQAKATDDRGASTFSDVVHVKVIGPPTVSISATDAHASEPGGSPANAGAFTITRTGGAGGPLRVHYLASGSASNGVDYAEVGNHVNFPAGQDSIQVVIDPLDDLLPDGREIVRVRLYHPIPLAVPAVYPPPPPAYYVSTNLQAVVFIADDDGGPTNQLPGVEIVSPVAGQTIAARPVFLRAHADDPDGRVDHVEFFANGESISVITNLQVGTPLALSPWVQLNPDQTEYVPLPMSSLSSFNLPWKTQPGEYVITAKAVDNNGAATVSDPIDLVVIKPTLVKLRASDPLASESGPNQGTFTITRTGSTNEELRVYYVLGGTAAYEIDYTLTPDEPWLILWPWALSDVDLLWPSTHVATIPAGQASVQVAVVPVDDELAERTEMVNVSLVAPPTIYPRPVELHFNPYLFIPYQPPPYQLGDRSRATVFIKDNDRGPRNHPPKASILAPQSGHVFPAGSDIAFEVKTTDRESYVQHVEFFDGVRKIGEATQNFLVPPPPGSPVLFEFNWANAPVGFHTLWARATDTLGGIGISTPVHIRVR